MATAYILNMYGPFEEKDGENGIGLYYGGVEFWLPYGKVSVFPNFTLREVDHDKSTPQGDTPGELIYKSVIVNGARIVEELCMKQVPVSNRDMGIIPIEGRPTGKIINVFAGWSDDGMKLWVEVPEREPLKKEIADAEDRFKRYMETMIADYFQSKRERMTGGKGLLHPSERIRQYMERLNVEDIDDVTTHQKTGDLDMMKLIPLLMEEMRKASEVNAQTLIEGLDTVRKRGKAQIAYNKGQGRQFMDLAANKAKWEAEHPEDAVISEAEAARRKKLGEMSTARGEARRAAKEEAEHKEVVTEVL